MFPVAVLRMLVTPLKTPPISPRAYDVTKRLSAGEGIPIGKRPCEFHRDIVDEDGVPYDLPNDEWEAL